MIVRTERFCPSLGRTISLDLYLPENLTADERCPVFYMLDGQNLFDDRQATFGTSWGLKEFLDRWSKPFIIVGLECDPIGDHRLHEYMPYPLKSSPFGRAEGKGRLLLDWIVTDLKPWIDAQLPTWPQREATAIGGSSMGGLMSFYAIAHYNDVFSKAACLSPSVLFCSQQALEDLKTLSIHSDTRIYASFGSEELGEHHRTAALEMMDLLESEARRQGALVGTRMIEGGSHSEASWRAQNPAYFHFLFAHPSQFVK